MTIFADGWWGWFRLALWSGAGFLLLLPLAAMQFRTEANWTASDFIIMGTMLVIACGAIELAMRASHAAAYSLGAIVAVGAGFLLTWVNLAVGIIGSEDNPLNLVYAGVLGVAVIGSLVGAFKPSAMARALFITAAAQTVVTILALVWGWGAWEPPGPAGILALNFFFAALWALSGGLFRRAALTERSLQQHV